MKRPLPTFLLLAGVAPFAFAHVGSPNVFFDGRAGTYSLYAVVRPPAALPGAAQVSVRVQDADVRSVSLLPVMWQSGRQGAPSPVAAERVAGETNLWSAEVWLLRPGSYTIQVSVEGTRETGEASVPVNALGLQGQQMSLALRATLLLFGLCLFVGAVFICGAIAREACLGPGVKSPAADSARVRRAVIFASLVLAGGVAAGAVRWRNMDLAYRTQGVQKPEPVMAAVRRDSDRVLVELRQAEQSVVRPSWAALVPDHGKLMHLFLIREPGLDVFAHLHPVRSDAHTFLLDAPALPAGGYQLYGDVTFENGISQTLVARVELPEPLGGVALPPLMTNFAGEVFCGFPSALATNAGALARDMDDSWHIGRPAVATATRHVTSRLMGGYTLRFENAAEVIGGRETSLRFAAFDPDGREVVLQPYMGMLGHAAVRRADGSVFAHLHPSGSFSMASQEVFRQREGTVVTNASPAGSVSSATTMSNRVSFPYQFPKPGPYRLWIQVRIGGRVLTGVYDVEIKAAA